MRRKSARDPKLSNLARFLRHVCELEELSQAELTDRVDKVSAATVSRWLSDKLTPKDDDLPALARAVGTTEETLRALRVLDAMGPKAPMFATSGAFYHLASGGGSTLLLAGVTMLAGTYYFRQVRLDGRTLLLSTTDPESEPARRFEHKTTGWDSGSLTLAWLTSLSVVAAAQRQDKNGGQVRIWMRPYLHVEEPDGAGEIAANDWLALETYRLPDARSRYVVHFYGDDQWHKRLAPFFNRLKEAQINQQGETLLWDSAWSSDDARHEILKRKLESVQRGMNLGRLVGPDVLF